MPAPLQRGLSCQNILDGFNKAHSIQLEAHRNLDPHLNAFIPTFAGLKYPFLYRGKRGLVQNRVSAGMKNTKFLHLPFTVDKDFEKNGAFVAAALRRPGVPGCRVFPVNGDGSDQERRRRIRGLFMAPL